MIAETLRMALAELCMRLDERPEAVNHAKEALYLKEDAPMHNLAGTALARMGSLPEAIDHFAAALRLDPANSPARSNLARARAELAAR